MKPLKLKVIFQPVTRYKDDSVGLKQVTAEEVSSEDFTNLDAYRGKAGWIVFKPNEPTIEDIPTEEAKIVGRKSASKRLHSALFAKYMYVNGSKEGFNDYYEKVMEGFIKSVNDSYER